MTSTVPPWITINSSTGQLQITAPDVNKDTEFDFFITSSVSGYLSPLEYLFKLTILNCNVQNCQKCISTNNSICEVCKPGYTFNSGACESPISTSETAKALSKTSISITLAIIGCVILASMLNTSSIANLWLTINQLQIFFHI